MPIKFQDMIEESKLLGVAPYVGDRYAVIYSKKNIEIACGNVLYIHNKVTRHTSTHTTYDILKDVDSAILYDYDELTPTLLKILEEGNQ